MKRILCALMLLTGCMRINKDISKEQPYADLIGRVYTTQSDLVVFRYSDSKNLLIAEPGSTNSLPQPEEMRETPFRFYDTHVLGLLPQGTELELVSVRAEGPPDMVFDTYYLRVLLTTAPEWTGKIVSPIDIESLGGGE